MTGSSVRVEIDRIVLTDIGLTASEIDLLRDQVISELTQRMIDRPISAEPGSFAVASISSQPLSLAERGGRDQLAASLAQRIADALPGSHSLPAEGRHRA